MGRRLLGFVACSGLLFMLAGCQLVPGSSSSGTAANQCTPDTVHQVVNRFIAAFNRGDLGQLDQLFALPGPGGFAWYATDAPGQRFNAEASNRDDLLVYFAARHSQHEHLALRTLDVTFTDGRRAGFWFRLTRTADGLLPTAYNGKGEIQCMFSPSSITVWAMDPNPWSPVELLPEAVAALLLLAAAVAVVVWRRRTTRR